MVRFTGFEPECKHALWLLPIVDFRFSFVCTKCWGWISTGWSSRISGMSTDDACKWTVDNVVSRTLDTECTFEGTVAPDMAFDRMKAWFAEQGIEWPQSECPGGCGCILGECDCTCGMGANSGQDV